MIYINNRSKDSNACETYKSVLAKQRTHPRTQGMKRFLGKAAGNLATVAMVSSPPDGGLCQHPRQCLWTTKQMSQPNA